MFLTTMVSAIPRTHKGSNQAPKTSIRYLPTKFYLQLIVDPCEQQLTLILPPFPRKMCFWSQLSYILTTSMLPIYCWESYNRPWWLLRLTLQSHSCHGIGVVASWEAYTIQGKPTTRHSPPLVTQQRGGMVAFSLRNYFMSSKSCWIAGETTCRRRMAMWLFVWDLGVFFGACAMNI
jgi:hypothetical protein